MTPDEDELEEDEHELEELELEQEEYPDELSHLLLLCFLLLTIQSELSISVNSPKSQSSFLTRWWPESDELELEELESEELELELESHLKGSCLL